MTTILIASAPEEGGGVYEFVTEAGDAAGFRRDRPVDGGDLRQVAGVTGLACLQPHPTLPVVYGLSSADQSWLYCWDHASPGSWKPVARMELPSPGVAAAVTPDGARLAVANYHTAQVSVTDLDAEGLPGVLRTVTLDGSGPDEERQESAHPHHVLDRDGRWLVTDLGADCLWELESRDLTVVSHSALPAGSGPRHAAVIDAESVAVSGELDVTAMLVAPGRSRPAVVSRSSAGSEGRGPIANAATRTSANAASRTSSADTAARTYPSDIAWHPAGFVIIANRGADTLGVLRRSGDRLELISETGSGGAWPLNMHLTGDLLYVANRDSDTVAVFHFSPSTAALTPVGAIDVPRPTWVCGLA